MVRCPGCGAPRRRCARGDTRHRPPPARRQDGQAWPGADAPRRPGRRCRPGPEAAGRSWIEGQPEVVMVPEREEPERAVAGPLHADPIAVIGDLDLDVRGSFSNDVEVEAGRLQAGRSACQLASRASSVSWNRSISRGRRVAAMLSSSATRPATSLSPESIRFWARRRQMRRGRSVRAIVSGSPLADRHRDLRGVRSARERGRGRHPCEAGRRA